MKKLISLIWSHLFLLLFYCLGRWNPFQKSTLFLFPEYCHPMLWWVEELCLWGPIHSLLIEWMFVFPQNLYVEAVAHIVMVLGDGIFGRWLRLDEVLRMEPPWMRLTCLEESQERLLCLLSAMQDTMRKQLSATRGRDLTRTWAYLHPDPRLAVSRAVRSKFLLCISPRHSMLFCYSSLSWLWHGPLLTFT